MASPLWGPSRTVLVDKSAGRIRAPGLSPQGDSALCQSARTCLCATKADPLHPVGDHEGMDYRAKGRTLDRTTLMILRIACPTQLGDGADQTIYQPRLVKQDLRSPHSPHGILMGHTIIARLDAVDNDASLAQDGGRCRIGSAETGGSTCRRILGGLRHPVGCPSKAGLLAP